MVGLPLVAIKGVHWVKDGPKFACNVDGCDASDTAKYNLYSICEHVTMLPWSRASVDTHLLGSMAQRFKIMRQ